MWPNEPNPNWPKFLTLRIVLASVFGFFWQKLLPLKDFSIEAFFFLWAFAVVLNNCKIPEKKMLSIEKSLSISK